MTDWKLTLIEHGMSAGESYLHELIVARVGEFAKGAIGAPFHRLCDRLSGASPNGAKIYHGALLHALTEAGWVDCGRLAAADLPTKKQVYAAPEVAERLSKSELRRLIEEPVPVQAAKLTAVK